GGAGVYTTYLWTPASGLSDPSIPNPLANPAVTTTYTVEITDQNGCHATDEVVVTVLPLPSVNAGPDALVCYGDALQLNAMATGGSGIYTTYLWSPTTDLTDPMIANPIASPVTSTNYTVTVTDDKGCQGSDDIFITINPMLSVDAGPDQSTCAGMMVFLNATPAGGTAPYTYEWSPAASLNNPLIQNPEATPQVTTVYTVTITDQNMCQATDDVEIIATALPVANAGADVAICFGQSTQLQASGGTTYQWSPTYGLSDPNISNPMANPPVTTTYTVTVSSICGVASDDVVITVNNLPSVIFIGLPSTTCINASPITLTGAPSGGTFSGPGIIGNTFDPALAGVGGPYAITYTYTDGNSCSNTATDFVTVDTIPDVPVFGYIQANVCINTAPIQLVGLPAGGVFSGPGVVGNTFDPALAGLGTKTLTYTVADINGCTNSVNRNVTVNPLPTVSFSGLAASYCADQAPVTLTGTPAGGFFSGTGISGNTFRPIVAGPGTYTITYQYNDMFGCVNTSSQVVTVHAVPAVSFVGLLNEYCVNAAPVTLVGNMGGSNFSGAGVLGNTFNPAVAGTGYTTITYAYTNPATGCSNSVTATVNVRPVSAIQIVAPANACINGTPVTLYGSPNGGTFSGTAVTGNQFNPVTAGLGTKVITYTYTNSYGCVSSTTHNITVQPLTTTTIGGLATSYCLPSAQTVTLAGFPAGGTFSGPGISGNSFNPQAAGTGTKVITYTAADMFGCVNSTTATTVVNSTPASFTGLASSYCLNAAPATLTGSTVGSTSGTFSGAGMTGNVFNPMNAGVGGHTVTYTITNPTTGCTGVASQYVVVHAIPVVGILNLTTDQCINGTPTTVITSPATGGTLSGPGITGNTFNPATAGLGTHTITYSFTNANSCTVTATQTVTVHALTSVSFSGLDPAYCEQDPVALLSPSPAGGIFSGPGMYGTAFRPWVAGTGNHTIVYTFKDANGCTNTASQPVTVHANPVINLGPDQTICINNVVTLDAGAGFTSYLWSTGETTQTIQVDGAFWKPGFHYFSVTVTNANGCSTTDIVRIIVSACTGIDDNVEISQVEVYPNPSDGLVNLLFNNFEGSYDMTILNDLGQTIMAEKIEVQTSGRFMKQIDLSTQPTGMYFIRLMNENTSKVVKVIIH
ncbi:MAG: T9SS type A sorting domain-containing protein, partial [Bacteroidales bacterium]